MIGCTVKASSRSGARAIRRKFRLASTTVSETAIRAALIAAPSVPCGGVAGEGEEDVVEGRPAHRDVVDADARVVQPLHRGGDRPLALGDRDAEDDAVA